MSEIAVQVAVPPTTEDQRVFLRRIRQYGGAATSSECGVSDRKADRARQRSRRQGLATFEGGYWRLTDRGRAVLSAVSE